MKSWSWLTGRWRMRWYPKNSRIASMRNWRWKQRLKQTWYEGSCKWNRLNLCQQAEPYKRWNKGMWGCKTKPICWSSHMCSCGVSIRVLNPCWQLYKKNIRCSSDNCRNWLPLHLPVRQIGQKLWRLGKDIRLHLLYFGEMSRVTNNSDYVYIRLQDTAKSQAVPLMIAMVSKIFPECCLNFHLSFSGAPRICRAAINSPEDERWDDVPRAPEPRICESWVRSKGTGRQCSKGAPNENIRSCLSKQSLARGKTTTCWNTGSSRFAWAVICAAAEWASEFWIHVGSSTRRTSGAAATIAEIGCHHIYRFVRSGRSCGDWAKIFGCICCILGRCQGSMTVVFTSYCKITSSSSDDSYSFNEVSECCLNWPSFATQQQEHVEFQRGNKMTDKVGAKVWDRVRDKVGNNLGDKLWDKVGDTLWDKAGDKVGEKAGDKVGDKVPRFLEP